MSMIDDPQINEVLSRLLAGARELLGGNFVGFYLHGSLMTGDFDQHSDIDFAITIRRDITDAELPAFQSLHEKIYAMPIHWAQHLEGSYLTLDFLQRYDPALPLHLLLDHGAKRLIRSDHDNYVLVRYIQREHGRTVAGPDIRTLIDPIAPEDLRQNMRFFLTGWYTDLMNDPTKFTSRWLQMYVVVSLCRVMYTLQHATVASKKAAVAWALREFDPKFRPLIEQAWADRPDPAAKCKLPADPNAVAATVELLRFATSRATARA